MISFEESLTVATMKSKSSNVRAVCILVTLVLGFFLEEYFRRETFLLFNESSSSLGEVSYSYFDFLLFFEDF
jgi:hypothetical protein